MGYKLLGFVVWKGAKWYLGRRVGSHAGTKAAAATGIGVTDPDAATHSVQTPATNDAD